MSENLLQQHQKLQLFLNKHKNHLSNQVKKLWSQNLQKYDLSSIGCSIISDHDQLQLKLAAKRLNQGKLVSFPTQTVYGLGANALDQKALIKIYQTKKRPLTDPIIVHILQPQDTFKYVLISNEQKKYFQILSKFFWPGPLTVILKANLDILPLVVTAQTGFVGIRCPNHPYFRKLLAQSKLPIGAPSANLFSHVSPTQAVHVFNDFYKDDVWIVDGGKCQFGIESTVLKIQDNELDILRQGSLSVNKIKQVLNRQLGKESPRIQIIKKTAGKEENTEAPGQLLKHYSPHLPCYFVESSKHLSELQEGVLKSIGLISFDGEEYKCLSDKVGKYFEVGELYQQFQKEECDEEQKFCTYEQKIIMREIYFLLRQAQNLPLSVIVIGWNGPKQGTVWDKIFRATEGKIFTFPLPKNQ